MKTSRSRQKKKRSLAKKLSDKERELRVGGEQRQREVWLMAHFVLVYRQCSTANLAVKGFRLLLL